MRSHCYIDLTHEYSDEHIKGFENENITRTVLIRKNKKMHMGQKRGLTLATNHTDWGSNNILIDICWIQSIT